MTLAEVHVKGSVILLDLLGPNIFSALWMDKFCIVSEPIWKFQVGHRFEMILHQKIANKCCDTYVANCGLS